MGGWGDGKQNIVLGWPKALKKSTYNHRKNL